MHHDYHKNTNFKFHKVVKIHYSGKVVLYHFVTIYSRQYIPSFFSESARLCRRHDKNHFGSFSRSQCILLYISMSNKHLFIMSHKK